MLFSVEAVPAEIPIHMRHLIEITGWEPWKNRLKSLEAQLAIGPTMSFYLVERFGLELAFSEIHTHLRQTARPIWPPKSSDQVRFVSFLAMVTRTHHRLSAVGKNRLKGMLIGALKSDFGLGPLAFEMKTVARLMRKQFDVEFHDLEEGGGFDFLISKDNAEIEIECKFITGDIGRKIHLKRLNQLTPFLMQEMEVLVQREHCGHLVRITIPDRLSGKIEQNQMIQELLAKLIAENRSVLKEKNHQLTLQEFDLEQSPFRRLRPEEITMEVVAEFLSDTFQLPNANALINFRPRGGVTIVVVQSAQNDAVLKGLHKQLKEAAGSQFSGDRPCSICCELADLSPEQLRSLGDAENEGTGLQAMVTDLFKRRPAVHTVSFTTPGTVNVEKSINGEKLVTSTQEAGFAYTFVNSTHPLSDDERYNAI